MSGIKKERTPEQIEAAKARMAAVRARKGSKPSLVQEAKQIVEKQFPQEHKRAASFLKKGQRSADPVLLQPEDLRAKSVPNEFEGMTAKDCCDSCYASNGERCAITHRGLCGHPMKGGLQQPDQMNPATVARYQKAKKILAHAKIEAA